ncbi:hypothetical protein [Metabacillus fastidiosus]|uniref:hypothetical protein n=1 Tax=Metabacillus fastidiosus TaxID=1458 RepID=UPI002DBF05B2|nr:hypothetical protein [Metabacillus fastidiosus]MEC2074886.1 hypothetical protein [Metabacillus fastidiosus]
MSLRNQNNIDKEQIIDTLIENQCYKMPDGRQFYEATENELKILICSKINDEFAFCAI